MFDFFVSFPNKIVVWNLRSAVVERQVVPSWGSWDIARLSSPTDARPHSEKTISSQCCDCELLFAVALILFKKVTSSI